MVDLSKGARKTNRSNDGWDKEYEAMHTQYNKIREVSSDCQRARVGGHGATYWRNCQIHMLNIIVKYDV